MQMFLSTLIAQGTVVNCPDPGCSVELKSGSGGISGWWPLVIAMCAFAGAIVAALVSGHNARKEEVRQNELRRRGVVGLIADDLHRAQGFVVEAFYNRRWWKTHEALEPRFGVEEVQRAATALEPERWRALASALRWVELLRVEAKAGTAQGLIVPSDEQHRWLAETFYRLEAARWALESWLQERSAKDKNRDDVPSQAGRWRPYREGAVRARVVRDHGPLPSGRKLTTLSAGAEAVDGSKLTPSDVVQHLEAMSDQGVSAHFEHSDLARAQLIPPALMRLYQP